MDYNDELVDALGREISEALRENNKPIVDAINNLAMNTGNKTTREYNELKKKYTELENKYKKSDSLLRSIITIYVATLVNHGYPASNNSDNVIHIMDDNYNSLQRRFNDSEWVYKSIFDISDEVYEKLIAR